MNSGQPVTSPSVPPPLEYAGLLPTRVCLLVVAGDMASIRLSGDSDPSRATARFHFNDKDQINHCHWRELEGLHQDTGWGNHNLSDVSIDSTNGCVHWLPLLQNLAILQQQDA